MLCQFTFKNFKSYKEETRLDLQATSATEFEETIILDEKNGRTLPVSVIYGPNGGGKSNLIEALVCLISIVVDPIYRFKKNRVKLLFQQAYKSCSPYKFDNKTIDSPTDFEIYFQQMGKEYRYKISVFNDEIISEALYWRTIGGKKTGKLFERIGSNIELGPSINSSKINKSVNPKMPYLSFLAITYDIPEINAVQSWFESCVIRNYANPNSEKDILIQENDHRLIKSLNNLGIDILGLRIDEDNNVYTQRMINDEIKELQFKEESEGTRKLIAVLPLIIVALQEGRLVVLDELDAKLHPKLLRYIIMLFKNKDINKNGAQLIFTSHDMTTMKNTVFRRDEIWFAAMNDDKSSEIYSLYDIRREDDEHINTTAAYSKQYLEGRYGADPYFNKMITGEWW